MNDNDVGEIKNIVTTLDALGRDKKFELCAELFLRAQENDHQIGTSDYDMRFLMLIMILDALLIPDQKSSKKIFAKRGSNILRGKNVTKNELEKYYQLRCNIIHNGFSDEFDRSPLDHSKCLADIARKTMRVYLVDISRFAW